MEGLVNPLKDVAQERQCAEDVPQNAIGGGCHDASGQRPAQIQTTQTHHPTHSDTIPRMRVCTLGKMPETTDRANCIKKNPVESIRNGTLLCKPGTTLIKDRWRIVEAIGAGGFGQIYRATDGKQTVAVKCESKHVSRTLLKMEVIVLKELQGEACTVKFLGCGRAPRFNYVIMGLVGDNLSILRKRMPRQRFSLYTVCEIAVQTLTAIRTLHEHGVLHRDIKPSNFAVGSAHNAADFQRIYVLDFGLSRLYRTAEGRVRAARPVAGFRGTARYASLNAHETKELGRRDDLWSHLYMLIEFASGSLPWRRLKDKADVAACKRRCTRDELTRRLPDAFRTAYSHLESLSYESCPDYDAMAQAWRALQHREASTGGTLDWLSADAEQTKSPPLGSSARIPAADPCVANKPPLTRDRDSASYGDNTVAMDGGDDNNVAHRSMRTSPTTSPTHKHRQRQPQTVARSVGTRQHSVLPDTGPIATGLNGTMTQLDSKITAFAAPLDGSGASRGTDNLHTVPVPRVPVTAAVNTGRDVSCNTAGHTQSLARHPMEVEPAGGRFASQSRTVFPTTPSPTRPKHFTGARMTAHECTSETYTPRRSGRRITATSPDISARKFPDARGGNSARVGPSEDNTASSASADVTQSPATVVVRVIPSPFQSSDPTHTPAHCGTHAPAHDNTQHDTPSLASGRTPTVKSPSTFAAERNFADGASPCGAVSGGAVDTAWNARTSPLEGYPGASVSGAVDDVRSRADSVYDGLSSGSTNDAALADGSQDAQSSNRLSEFSDSGESTESGANTTTAALHSHIVASQSKPHSALPDHIQRGIHPRDTPWESIGYRTRWETPQSSSSSSSVGAPDVSSQRPPAHATALAGRPSQRAVQRHTGAPPDVHTGGSGAEGTAHAGAFKQGSLRYPHPPSVARPLLRHTQNPRITRHVLVRENMPAPT
eukprot:m.483613 g.483613  ORF g.483613 m.483613 type:complete len:942 (-) comp21728_c1_seq2:54-2879(-)